MSWGGLILFQSFEKRNFSHACVYIYIYKYRKNLIIECFIGQFEIIIERGFIYIKYLEMNFIPKISNKIFYMRFWIFVVFLVNQRSMIRACTMIETPNY